MIYSINFPDLQLISVPIYVIRERNLHMALFVCFVFFAWGSSLAEHKEIVWPIALLKLRLGQTISLRDLDVIFLLYVSKQVTCFTVIPELKTCNFSLLTLRLKNLKTTVK